MFPILNGFEQGFEQGEGQGRSQTFVNVYEVTSMNPGRGGGGG